MNKQQSIGAWTMGLGKLLLVAMFVICVIDILGLQERGGLMLSLTGYLTGIFTGVVMQFVGAAIPNMKFTPAQS
ncbi:MAG: hypothetical protein ACI8TQ_003949 [Planctomycetota bacterium]|jgi:hypothetical protein